MLALARASSRSATARSASSATATCRAARATAAGAAGEQDDRAGARAEPQFVLSEFGDVYAWGRGFEGQLGLGTLEVSLCPKYVSAFQGTPIAQLGAGGNHSVALSSTGQVFCWGEALSGQVGTGRVSSAGSPTAVQGLPAIKSISCGYTHTAALSEEGQMYSWGVANRGPTALKKEDRFRPELLPPPSTSPSRG